MKIFQFNILADYNHHVVSYRWFQFKPDRQAANNALQLETAKLIEMIKAKNNGV